MTDDTTTLSYWLNWRYFLSALWLSTSMIISAYVIWRFEGPKISKTKRGRDAVGTLYKDETWKTCFEFVHPKWLLVYRISAFGVLLGFLIGIAVMHGRDIFYFYTQWTFALVTTYFGLAVIFSTYGCWTRHREIGGEALVLVRLEVEGRNYEGLTWKENTNMLNGLKSMIPYDQEPRAREIANIMGYVFQIIFQTSVGAAVLTDLIFWFVIYPFLSSDDYGLTFMDFSMHSINALFLFGDMILNRMQFPLFRIAYFIWWTSIYVIYQWVDHARFGSWWPYWFLDLSSPYAPMWYLALGFLHLPCFSVFVLLVRSKKFVRLDIPRRL